MQQRLAMRVKRCMKVIRPGALLVLLLVYPASLLADLRSTPEMGAVRAIVSDPRLSKEEKIARLRQGPRDRVATTLYFIKTLDPDVARTIARNAFSDPETPRLQKLQIGKLLITSLEDPSFIDEYAPFLVQAVVRGGEEEFMQKRPSHQISAVGEYVFIASDFDGMNSRDFPKLADVRVIPILMRCLDAPDHIWPEEPVTCMGGKPGESTGRNTQRQQIPVALAKLRANEAIPILKRVLAKHHDWHERFNSAYALGMLMDGKDSRALMQRLKDEDDKDALHMLFGLGRGLLDRGDSAGVELMAFKYSIYHGEDEANSVLYMLEERMPFVRKAPGTSSLAFYKEAMTYRQLRKLLLFDRDAMRVRESLGQTEDMRQQMAESIAERVRKDYGQMLSHITTLGLRELRPMVNEIGRESRDREIQRLSAEAVGAMAE